MTDDQETNNAGRAARPDGAARTAACARELTEALTALGSWLAAANLEVRGTPGLVGDKLRRTIQESIAQQRRAGSAVRELHELLRDAAGGGNEPIPRAD